MANHDADVRGDLLRDRMGKLALSDIFNVSPLGIGPDGVIGYPVASFYLTLYEIKMLLEQSMAFARLFNYSYGMSTSGLRVEFDSTRAPMPGDRITRLNLYQGNDESDVGADVYDVANGGYLVNPYTMISMSTSLVVAQFLMANGITPRDAWGQPLQSLPQVIAHYPDTREIKVWWALMTYIAGFHGQVPDAYNPDADVNPFGPAWRRGFDLAAHR